MSLRIIVRELDHGADKQDAKAAWLSSRRQALEEAADLCKRNESGVTAGGSFAEGMRSMARHLASAIRREAEGK